MRQFWTATPAVLQPIAFMVILASCSKPNSTGQHSAPPGDGDDGRALLSAIAHGYSRLKVYSDRGTVSRRGAAAPMLSFQTFFQRGRGLKFTVSDSRSRARTLQLVARPQQDVVAQSASTYRRQPESLSCLLHWFESETGGAAYVVPPLLQSAPRPGGLLGRAVNVQNLGSQSLGDDTEAVALALRDTTGATSTVWVDAQHRLVRRVELHVEWAPDALLRAVERGMKDGEADDMNAPIVIDYEVSLNQHPATAWFEYTGDTVANDGPRVCGKGMLGLELAVVGDAVAIADVYTKSRSYDADVRQGDILDRVNSTSIKASSGLQHVVRQLRQLDGQAISLLVRRGPQTVRIEIPSVALE